MHAHIRTAREQRVRCCRAGGKACVRLRDLLCAICVWESGSGMRGIRVASWSGSRAPKKSTHRAPAGRRRGRRRCRRRGGWRGLGRRGQRRGVWRRAWRRPRCHARADEVGQLTAHGALSDHNIGIRRWGGGSGRRWASQLGVGAAPLHRRREASGYYPSTALVLP